MKVTPQEETTVLNQINTDLPNAGIITPPKERTAIGRVLTFFKDKWNLLFDDNGKIKATFLPASDTTLSERVATLEELVNGFETPASIDGARVLQKPTLTYSANVEVSAGGKYEFTQDGVTVVRTPGAWLAGIEYLPAAGKERIVQLWVYPTGVYTIAEGPDTNHGALTPPAPVSGALYVDFIILSATGQAPDGLDAKLDKTAVKQTTGTGTIAATEVMSRDATTKELAKKLNASVMKKVVNNSDEELSSSKSIIEYVTAAVSEGVYGTSSLIQPGKYLTPLYITQWGNFASQVHSTNLGMVTLFYPVDKPIKINSIQVQVNTADATNTTRFGLYGCGLNGRPAGLLANIGTATWDTTGTINIAFPETQVNPPGFFIGHQSNAANAALRAVAGSNGISLLGVTGVHTNQVSVIGFIYANNYPDQPLDLSNVTESGTVAGSTVTMGIAVRKSA